MIPTKPNYTYKQNYDSLETKLKPEQKDKYADLKRILDTSEFYKNCMYCGRIYEGNYEKAVYQNGVGPLTEEFNDYQISTGVGPCCMDIYRKRLEEVTEYNPKNIKVKSIIKTRPSYVYQNK